MRGSLFRLTMIGSAINLLVVGLVAGFIFSIPVAGPIAVLVVTNSLKNRARFANRVALGASLVEFVYVFLAMFGITSLIKYYQPFIPYLFILGGILLFYVARKIFKSHISIESMEYENQKEDNEKGGLRAGMIINITNPTIFFGWLTSSFLILSFAASLGLNTGGMEKIVRENAVEISKITEERVPELKQQTVFSDSSNVDENSDSRVNISPYQATVLSMAYAAGISLGGYLWFFLFGGLIRKHRQAINPKYLNVSLKVFSVFLIGLALYFLYLGVEILI